VKQGCTNPARQVGVANKLCIVVTNICVRPVRNLLHFTLTLLGILMWLKICAPLHRATKRAVILTEGNRPKRGVSKKSTKYLEIQHASNNTIPLYFLPTQKGIPPIRIFNSKPISAESYNCCSD
jgi:hypothetical protein